MLLCLALLTILCVALFQAGNVPGTAQQSASDWQEYEAADGRR